jgi:hypothetical protein
MMLELPCCPSVIARTIFIVFFHHRSYGGGGHKPNGARSWISAFHTVFTVTRCLLVPAARSLKQVKLFSFAALSPCVKK